MNETIKTDFDTQLQAKKMKQISLILVVVGLIAAISLVFFFFSLYRMRSSNQVPQIFEVKQIGATDHAVLISWSSSKEAQQFIVRCKSADGRSVPDITCQTPFAAVELLEPNQLYRIKVIPVANGQEYKAASINCHTESFCNVTEVSATDVGCDFVDVSWKSEGKDTGFVAIAYALDMEGKRHFTSRKVHVPAGQSECRISGLLSNLHYTVAVMPKTKYGTIAKSVFTTTEYSEQYRDIRIIRFVICSFSSENTLSVRALKTVEPSSSYQTSLIISGKASASDKRNMDIYITDEEDRLVVEAPHPGILLNPKGESAYAHRVVLLPFQSPSQEGAYSLYLTFNGRTVKREPFHVVKPET